MQKTIGITSYVGYLGGQLFYYTDILKMLRKDAENVILK